MSTSLPMDPNAVAAERTQSVTNEADPITGMTSGRPVVHTPSQQAATMPGSGGRSEGKPNVQATNAGGKLPFKEQVKAYAHIHHGTVTRNKEEKETHQKVLAGELPPQ